MPGAPRKSLARAVLAAFALSSADAVAAPEDDPKPRAVDPGVASGPWVGYAERPTPPRALRACSARAPICVHGETMRDRPIALSALEAFERAWQTLTGALEVATPDLDPTTLAYDVFLGDGVAGLVSTELEARDVRSRVDRARAFTRLDRMVSAGCTLDALAAVSVSRASLYRSAPATEEGTARAQTAYLAALATPCTIASSADVVQAFQTRPERTFADAHVSDDDGLSRAFSAGGATFWGRLDWAYGRRPGAIVLATWALHPTMTALGASRWNNEPDTFDVLRMSFKSALTSGGTVNDLWLDFGIARAFVGSADDGLHFPELRTLGDAARVPVDWDVAWPREPHRFAPRQPVAPTGASYVLVRHAGARPGARLRAEIEWEEHALFRWAFVKIDATGRELGRVTIPTTERATQAQMTLVDLDGVDRVLIVGVNVGDPAYAFDPDDEIWEPHGWLVTLAEE